MTAEADLRLGDWQTALADVDSVDTLIVDAPYSAKTHVGHDAFKDRPDNEGSPTLRKQLGYRGWDHAHVSGFVEHWHPRCRGWIVTITDHLLAQAWADSLAAAGRYVFAPVPWVALGSRVRLAGDGPSCWTCWIVVARHRCEPWSKWGTLPGAYVITTDRGARGSCSKAPITGTKPLALMQALVRDYSRPGDLICDPCAGTGTTLLAARSLGRRSVGAELDPKTHAFASQRLLCSWQPELFA